MAKLTLTIVGNNTDALKKVDAISGALQKIETKPVKIKIEAVGDVKALQAYAKLEAAQARIEAAKAKASAAAAKEKAAETALATAKEKTAAAAQKAAAAEESTAQSYTDAARAVREYYQALSLLGKTNNDVRLTKSGWESESGKWDALAQKLNRTTTAFNQLTSAENINKMSEDEQLRIKRLLATEAEKFAIEIEQATNKEAVAMAKAAEAQRKYMAEAIALYEQMKAEAEANAPNTPIQERIESMLGIGDERKSARASAKVFERELSNLDAKVQKTASSTNGAAAATNKFGKETKEATGLTKLMGASLGEIAAKMTAWMVMGNIVASMVRSFRDAIETMREVDTALVTVQKVTGFTGDQIDALTEKTYELASAYGRTADELMNLTADFARAGFSDNLSQMTELAALLENVGDLEQGTASKFLLAANAAWQLGGNYDSLMEIIDGMNAVTNQAAVDMEALTNGITVAGSVFATAGETAQTYTALVGTAVAATQRSGNEIARGLRTIAMNVRGIKGELDDGEIIDEESISKASEALYSVGIHVADANGELRLTSDILDDLAKKWDTLTSGEQSKVAEALAGKRQANILTALMQNWGEVERQMELYANGAGSALKENEIYLDSWEAKSRQLKAAWVEFISGMINTDQIKGVLDVMITLVNALDSGFGKFVITVGLLTTVVAAGAKAFTALKTAMMAAAGKGFIAGLITLVEGLIGAITGATTATEVFTLVWSISPFALVAAGIAAVYGIVKLVDALTVSTKEAAEGMREASRAYDEAEANISSLNEKLRQNIDLLIEANMYGKDDAYKERLAEENELLREQIDEQFALANVKRQEAVDNAMIVAQNALGTGQLLGEGFAGPGYVTAPTAEDVEKWIEARDVLQDYVDWAHKFGVAVDDDIVNALAHVNEQIDLYTESQVESNEATRAAVESYDFLYNALEQVSATGEVSSEVLQQLVAQFPQFQTELINASGNAGEFARVLIEMINQLLGGSDAAIDTSGSLDRLATSLDSSSDPAEWLAAILNEDVTAFNNEADAANNAALQTAFFTAKAEAADGTPISTLSACSSLSSLEGQSYNTAAALIALNNVFNKISTMDSKIATVSAKMSTAVKGEALYWGTYLYSLQSERNGMMATMGADFLSEYNSIIANMPRGGSSGSGGGGGGSSGSGGGGGGGSSTDPILEAHKNRVSLLEAELALMKERGDSEEAQAAQMRLVQEALHDEAEYLRSIEGESENVLKLSTEWWKYENELAKMKKSQLEIEQAREKLLKSELALMQERGDEESLCVAKHREIQESLHRQAELLRQTDEYLRGDQETLAEINALSTEWWSIQNSIIDAMEKEALARVDAAEKAATSAMQEQLDLLKAQKDEMEEAREEEEKLLAVEKARIALENAQRERNIRSYNAATGQWEWVANAKTVESARESLEKAERDLSDYYTNRAITALERNIQTIQGSYDALRAAISEFAQKVREGTESLEAAFAYLANAAAGTEEEVITSAAGAFSGGRTVRVQANGNAESGLSVGDQVVTGGGTYTIVEHGTPGSTYNPESGYSSVLTDPSKTTAGTGGSSSGGKSSSGGGSLVGDVATAFAMGGVTAAIGALGIVTSGRSSLANSPSAGARSSSIGSQHNGDNYSVNGVTISESSAKSTTLYDFAQASRGLALRSGG